jgi:hypothetical protein
MIFEGQQKVLQKVYIRAVRGLWLAIVKRKTSAIPKFAGARMSLEK